jgi:hypothetical protein
MHSSLKTQKGQENLAPLSSIPICIQLEVVIGWFCLLPPQVSTYPLIASKTIHDGFWD